MDVGALPVLDGKALAGMVTDRDITVRGVAAGMIAQESLVSDVMTEDVRLCRADDSVEQVMDEMGDAAGAPARRARREQRDRRHRCARRLRHPTIARTPTKLCARSRRPLVDFTTSECAAALSARAPDRSGGAARAAPPVGVRLAVGQGLSRQSGAAARRRGRLLRAALDRAAPDPDRVRALAASSTSASCSPPSAATWSGWCRASRTRSSASSRTSSTSARASAGCCSAR